MPVGAPVPTELGHATRERRDAVLFRLRLELADEHADGPPPSEVEEARRSLRDIYAEAQMVASDEVLAVGGGLVHQLSRIQRLLDPPGPDPDSRETRLEEARGRLEHASEGLYEVRQTMRRDLGITELPIGRPDGYGV
ncbi:hypothetical protein ACWC2K_01270 [Streptomyces chattanoogensis]